VTVPLAHLGHFLWILYLLPVAIVVGAIVRAAWTEKRAKKKGSKP
jgi:hypothetical protein